MSELPISPANLAGSPAFPPHPVRRIGLVLAGGVTLVFLGVVLLYVVVYLLRGLGPGAFEVAGVLALVPLTIVLLGIRWVDRWEPEPRVILAAALLWGAGVSVFVALVVGAEIDNVVASLGGAGGAGREFFGAVIQAPLVEEGGKGVGVLLLFLLVRRHFDGPVDGLVYGATVAAGFAFTENILYFGQALTDPERSGNLVELFVIRGLLSPFAHVMFTSCTGLLLGVAARHTNVFGAIALFFVGLIPAMALHALWNGALYFVGDFYGYYVLVQVPLFLLALVLVRYLRRREARLTGERLSECAAAGWFDPQEIPALATPEGRRVARAWARERHLGPVMKKYLRDATRLAFTRQRVLSGRGLAGARADESRLLAEIVRTRQAFLNR